MLLPIRTNIIARKTPYTNYALIIINAVIFMLTFAGGQKGLNSFADKYMLTPAYPYLWQFITYAFLHGSLGHIFGNMYFLYIFGNNVNERLGNLGYLCFYLAGAVFSGVGHIAAASMYGNIATPVLGASGAIAAVTGAYLVLFPQSLITIIYWFFFIGTMEIPAIYLIALKMIFLDNVIARSAANVAYDAHLAGYGFGVITITALLAVKILSPDQFDLWAMLSRWFRRKSYQRAVAVGGDPFSARLSKKIKVKEVLTDEQIEAQAKLSADKQKILSLLNQGNLASAADLYLQLCKNNSRPDSALPKQALLDIANQMMSEGKWQPAADTYEKFISYYDSSYQHSEQVMLMLGIIYARYLDKKDKALDYLTKAQNRLHDEGQIKMCQSEIEKLNKN